MKLIGLGIALALASLTSEGYQSIRDEHGVRVYRRTARKTIDLGAEGRIEAPPAVVRAALLDYENHPRWLDSLAESHVLTRAADSLDVYQRLALPVIADRDYTLHVTFGDSGAEMCWLRFRAVMDRGPAPRPRIVRVSRNEGSWRLYALDGGAATYAVYQFSLDLAGRFPAWLGNGRAAHDVVALFDKVRDQTRYYRTTAATSDSVP